MRLRKGAIRFRKLQYFLLIYLKFQSSINKLFRKCVDGLKEEHNIKSLNILMVIITNFLPLYPRFYTCYTYIQAFTVILQRQSQRLSIILRSPPTHFHINHGFPVISLSGSKEVSQARLRTRLTVRTGKPGVSLALDCLKWTNDSTVTEQYC